MSNTCSVAKKNRIIAGLEVNTEMLMNPKEPRVRLSNPGPHPKPGTSRTLSPLRKPSVTVTRYRLYDTGFESQQTQRLLSSPKSSRLTLWSSPSLTINRHRGSFRGGNADLACSFHLVSRLRIRGATPLLPLHAAMACKGAILLMASIIVYVFMSIKNASVLINASLFIDITYFTRSACVRVCNTRLRRSIHYTPERGHRGC